MRLVIRALVAAAAVVIATPPAHAARLVIADLGTSESAIVGQVYGLALEAKGHEVVYRRAASSAVAHAAISAGTIDLYPESTASAHLAILDRLPVTDLATVLAGIREAYAPLGLIATTPAPLSTAGRVACTRQIVSRLRLRSLASLRRHPKQIVYAATRGHLLGPDGLVVLGREYGALFRGLEVQPTASRYSPIRDGRAHCIHALATDPEPARLGLVVLRDDKGAFTGTPARGFVVLRQAAADAAPGLQAEIDGVSAVLATSRVRALNDAVLRRRRPVRRTAADFLLARGLITQAFADQVKAVAPETLADVPAGAPPVGTTDRNVRVYFIRGLQIAPRQRTLPAGLAPEATVREAIRRLLIGPTGGEKTRLDVRTVIPRTTTLLEVRLRGSVATIDLSDAFAAGEDQTAIAARIAQVVMTADQFTFVDSVRVLVGSQGSAASWRETSVDPPATVVVPRPGPGVLAGNVADVQQRLIELRYLPSGTATGRYDYRTRQAVMAFQSWTGLERDGFTGPATRAALTDATAPVPTVAGGRRIEVHRRKGVVLLVDAGKVVRAIHTSTGKPGFTTPLGTYRIYRSEARDWSHPFQIWVPSVSYFSAGYGLHEYADVPTFPASHGSVWIPAPEAPTVHAFATVGTTVAVY